MACLLMSILRVKDIFAHGGNWIELVNKDTSGNLTLSGDVDITSNFEVTGVSTFTGDVSLGSSISLGDGKAIMLESRS